MTELVAITVLSRSKKRPPPSSLLVPTARSVHQCAVFAGRAPTAAPGRELSRSDLDDLRVSAHSGHLQRHGVPGRRTTSALACRLEMGCGPRTDGQRCDRVLVDPRRGAGRHPWLPSSPRWSWSAASRRSAPRHSTRPPVPCSTARCWSHTATALPVRWSCRPRCDPRRATCPSRCRHRSTTRRLRLPAAQCRCAAARRRVLRGDEYPPPASGAATAHATIMPTRSMRVAVVLMRLPGSSAQPVTKASLQASVFGPTNSVANWYSQMSGGQVTVTGTVYGYYGGVRSCDLSTELAAAAAAQLPAATSPRTSTISSCTPPTRDAISRAWVGSGPVACS